MDDGTSEVFAASCLIIGNGSIAKKHIRACQAHHENIQIYQVPSRDRVYLEEIPGLTRGETIDSVLGKIKFDFAIVCSPASHHAHHLKLILDKNKIPILVEKPLSDLAKKLANFFETDKELVKVAYCLRHLPVVSAFKDHLKKYSSDNKIRNVYVHCLSNAKIWRDESFLNTVSAKRELGGGVLRELSHEIDLVTWLFGIPEAIETHYIKYLIPETDVESATRFSFYYGHSLTVEFNLDFGAMREVREVRVETNDASSVVMDINEHQLEIDGEIYPVVDKDMYATQLEVFIEMTKGQNNYDSLCSFHHAEIVLSLVEKVEKSYQEGQRICYAGC